MESDWKERGPIMTSTQTMDNWEFASWWDSMETIRTRAIANFFNGSSSSRPTDTETSDSSRTE